MLHIGRERNEYEMTECIKLKGKKISMGDSRIPQLISGLEQNENEKF
jgi:hypothetical protein